MSFAIAWVGCIALFAFVAPILVFVSVFLLYRRIQQERQKSSISRIKGLDPPPGTRDPALLWPSVLATPAASADAASLARSGSQADEDDNHTARRPASVASNHSSTSTASSTHQSSPTSSRPAKHGMLTLLTALTAPPAAAGEGCSNVAKATQQTSSGGKPCSGTSSSSSATSSEGRSSGDCRMNINDIQRCRDQTRAAAAATVHSAVSVGHPKPICTTHQPHQTAVDDVVRHWGSPRGTRADALFACRTLDRHNLAHHGVDTVRKQPVTCV